MGQNGSIFSRLFGKGGGGRSLSLEEKLAKLAECGISLAPPYTMADLLDMFERSEYEEAGFQLLLSRVTGSGEAGEWDAYCKQVFSFDTECIYSEGTYSTAMAVFAAQSNGALEFSDIKDTFLADQQEGESSFPVQLSFICNGQRYEYNFVQEDDWFHTSLFGVLAALLATTTSQLRYFEMDTGDQSALIGCLTAQQIEKLSRLDGVGALTILDDRLPVAGLREL